MTERCEPDRDRIPKRLKSIGRWVGWRFEEQVDATTGEVKTKKVPYRADGRGRADVTKRAHWGTLAKVMDSYWKGRFDGIGFVFSDDDDIMGIDLDACRDPETGQIEDWARRIIDSFQTYCEASPSGTGVHIILRGHRPAGAGNRKGHVEIYESARFFTMTGMILRNVRTVDRCQDALDALCAELWPPREGVASAGLSHDPPHRSDAVVLEGLLRDPKRAALWGGDMSDYEDNHSRADMALLCHLAWRTHRDEPQMDRLFRQSGLFRPMTKHPGYLPRSIRRAVARLKGRGYRGRG